MPVAIEGTEEGTGEPGTTELFALEATIVLRIDQRFDDLGEVTETRFTLDFRGTMRMIYLGNIATAAGRMVLVISSDSEEAPQFWGVFSLETNFEKLLALGIETDLFATLQINTTDQERVETITLEGQATGGGDLVETYTLAPNLFRIEAAGKLIMGIPKADGTGVDVQLIEISGGFSMIISSEGMTIFAQATVSIGPENFKLGGLEALGLLIINDEGFSIRLELTRGMSIPLLEFNASFALIINSTKQDQEFEIPAKFFEFLSPKFLEDLQFGKGDQLFNYNLSSSERDQLNADNSGDGSLPGSVAAAFGSNGLDLSGAVSVRTVYTDARWEITDAAGNEYIIEKNDALPDTVDIYESRGKKFVVIPRGPPGLDGTIGETDEFVVVNVIGTLNVANLLVFDGKFQFLITSTSFELFLSATLDLSPLGSAGVTGQLVINADGAYGGFEIAFGSGLGSGVFNIQGRFQLELNTTGKNQSIQSFDIDSTTGQVLGMVPKTLAADVKLQILVAGEITIGGAFVIKGSISMVFADDGFELAFDATLDLSFFGNISVTGGAIIRGDVLAIYLALGVNDLGFGPFALTGSFTLQINTSSEAQTVNGHVVQGSTFLVQIAAELQIWILKATGSITLGVENGVFIMSLDNLEINFFNFVTLTIRGFIKGDGSFLVEARVTIDIPLGPFRLEGGLEIRISNGGNDGFTLFGRAWGSISIHIGLPWPLPDIDITLASIEGLFEYRAASIRLGLKISVGPFDMSGEIVWSFATPVLARMSGSTLYLNMGVDAVHRGKYFKTDNAESYVISHVLGPDGAETVSVAAMGQVQNYSGVSRIVVTNAGEGDDFIQVNAGVLADVEIEGGVGNDALLSFGSGRSTLRGGDGDDLLYGGDGDDTMFGGSGNDELSAGNGNNTLHGDAGNDIIRGGNDVDTAHGGDGDDTIDTYDGNDVVTGGNGNDRITTGKGDDLIDGGDGDDEIYAGAGADTVIGGPGRDFVDAGEDDDTVFGDLGQVAGGTRSTLSPTVGARDVIFGRGGNDVIFGGAANDDIYGEAGDDVLLGDFGTVSATLIASAGTQGGVDLLVGSSGNDVLIGGADGDTLRGDDGNDVLLGDFGRVTATVVESTDTASGGNDQLFGDAGADTVVGGVGSDTVRGGSGNDQLAGDSANIAINGLNFLLTSTDTATGGNDTVSGDSGDDILVGGAGKDTLSGNSGRDLLVGDNAEVLFTESGRMLRMMSTATTDGDDDLLDVTGSEGADFLVGGVGQDTLNGGPGSNADVLLGDHGVIHGDDGSAQAWHVYTTAPGNGDIDQLNGGPGDDVILGGSGGSDVDGVGGDVINGDAGSDFIAGDQAYVTRDASERVIRLEAEHAEPLYIAALTTGGDDQIDLVGNAGADVIMGGFGADRILGGAGNNQDVLFGDHGEAIRINGAIALAGARSVQINIGRRDYLDGGGGNDIIYGGGDGDTLLGNSGDDHLFGDDGDDYVFGDTGTVSGDETLITTGPTSIGGSAGDVISGGNGIDLLFGGRDGDTITGGNGEDVLIGDFGTVTRSVTGDVLTALTTDTLGYADNLAGEAGDDLLLGGNGNDTVTGGADADAILGDHGTITRTAAGVVTDVVARDNLGGADTIDGGSADDLIVGGAAADVIVAGTGNDVVIGDFGNIRRSAAGALLSLESDTSLTVGGPDTISGDDNNDHIIAGSGNDTVTAGAGNDVVLADNGSITLGLAAGSAVLVSHENDPAAGNDSVTAGSGDDLVIGGAGNDVIAGDAGRDVLLGDSGEITAGDDTLDNNVVSLFPTENGADTVRGGADDDIVIGGTGADKLSGDAGADILIGDNGYVTRATGTLGTEVVLRIESRANVGGVNYPSFGGNDIIDANDTIVSGPESTGSDTVIAGTGNDTVNGGWDAANDVLLGDNGVVVRNDGSAVANDIFSIDPDFGGRDTIDGGGGDDLIIGGSFDVYTTGLAGDTLHGGSGADHVLGDNGWFVRDATDLLLAVHSTFGEFGDDDQMDVGGRNGGVDTLIGGIGDDTLAGGTADNAVDVLIGDSAVVLRNQVNNQVHTSRVSDVDTLTTADDLTHGGTDTISGGGGADLIIGGSGGTDSGATGDTLVGDSGDDVIVGDNAIVDRDGADVVLRITSIHTGNGGRETISGSAGNDIIIGGLGNDQINGQAGNDTIFGDSATVVRFETGAITDFDAFSIDAGVGGEDTITGGTGNDLIAGGAANDTISGGDNNDTIFGDSAYFKRGAGDVVERASSIDPAIGGDDDLAGDNHNDNIVGGVGADDIDGGADAGIDLLFGDNAVIVSADPDADPADAALDPDLAADNDNDAFTISPTLGGPDVINGGPGNDVIAGGTDDDILKGDSGDDVVFGDGAHITRDAADSPTLYETRSPDVGGNDEIDYLTGSDGLDRLFGGQGDDIIDGGPDNTPNVILGDNGRIGVIPSDNDIWTTDPTTGGNDLITGGPMIDVILGGSFDDNIIGNASADFLFGDGGTVFLNNDDGVQEVVSRDEAFGGDDFIDDSLRFSERPDFAAYSTLDYINLLSLGSDYIIGGTGSDVLTGGQLDAGQDIIVGDNGFMTRNGAGQIVRETVLSHIASPGTDDDINGGLGADLLWGGPGNDVIVGDEGNDFLAGDPGNDVLWGGFVNIAKAHFLGPDAAFENPPFWDDAEI